MWYILVVVLGSVLVLGITTIIMNHTYICCIHMYACGTYIVAVLHLVMALGIPTLCSIMSKQHVELLLVKIELLNKILLHCVTLDSNKH